MGYPWSAHDILTASDLNAAFADVAAGISGILNPARCIAYQAVAQSLTSGTAAAVTMDAELVDNSAMHSTLSNTSRIVVPTTGWYRAYGSVGFASNATGYRMVELRLNGTTIAQQRGLALSGVASVLSLAYEYALSAGQYLELWATQTSGGALNTATGQQATFLHVVRATDN